eukprot:TRINITY_DN9362_c0_g1_i3.p1 TRINITY_DN9362_c0_g1~~TRINITY_DN9362_c0_g1_i3.p1  ORF type:complete len:374 (-),score=69.06 TRINITY_DN9362_c0_g1_i3:283-1404(-)
MDKISEETKLGHALELEKAKKYKDCANVVAVFSLHSKMNMRNLLTQLLIQNHTVHAKRLAEYSEEYKKLMINLMCSNDYSKKAAGFIKSYGYSIFDFPHLIIRLQKKTVRYYINMMFFQKPPEQMSLSQVTELFSYYTSIQIILMDDILYHKRFEEAWIVLNHFSLWSYFSPEIAKWIKGKVADPEGVLKAFKDSNVDAFGPLTPNAFRMPCSYEDVVFVEDSKGLEKANELHDAKIIGIDSEWRPALMTFVNVKPTILQIASEKLFVIFDLVKLENNEDFKKLISSLFMSMSIFKLGLGLKEDMRLICSSYPSMACFRHMFNYVDISDLYKETHPHEKQSSLAAVTEKMLRNHFIRNCRHSSLQEETDVKLG